MKKSFKQYLAIYLVFCFFFSEWGNYGFTVNAAASSLTISGANTISTIKKGNSWTCKGTVSSNCMLKEVRGTIYESDGLTVKYRKSVSPNSSAYTLQNGEIDRALLFNTLQPGTYYYAIDATDASGTKKTLVNNKFTVQGSGGSTLKITGASTISSLKQGNLWTCRGTVSSNYVLKEVKGTIYESDGIKVRYQKSVYPNKKSYKIQNGEIDKALLFNNLSAGTYYYTIVASDVSGRALTLVRNKFTVQGQSIAASTLKITGASTISSLKQGSSWTCKGTVSSNYVLKEVRGTIYESNGITVKYRKSVYPNSKSYTLQNGEIDRALLFNKLPVGTYHYTIVAFDMSGIEKTLVNNKFIVQGKTSAASKLKITGASKISSIQQGKSWSCKGTVSSNYAIQEVRGTIYESDGITIKYRKSVYPNGKSYKIENGEIDRALLFNNLPAGTYHYTIVARDASGEKEKTLVNNRFTVKANAASTLKIVGASTPGSLTKGSSWTCTGIISSNYNITSVTGNIYKSNGITKEYTKTVKLNKKSYSLKNSTIDKALLFNRLGSGNYYYTIVATDSSGQNLTLVNVRFEIKERNASGNRKVLNIDKQLLSQVGSMKAGDYTCGAYAWAYCTTYRDKKVHKYSEYWRYNASYKAYVAHWDGSSITYPVNEKKALRKVYDVINSGKPCVLFVTQKSGGQHYIMVYGYTNVSDPNKMTKDNLVFVDPYAYGSQQYYDGNVGNIKKIGVEGSKHTQQVIWCK